MSVYLFLSPPQSIYLPSYPFLPIQVGQDKCFIIIIKNKNNVLKHKYPHQNFLYHNSPHLTFLKTRNAISISIYVRCDKTIHFNINLI